MQNNVCVRVRVRARINLTRRSAPQTEAAGRKEQIRRGKILRLLLVLALPELPDAHRVLVGRLHSQ